MNLYFVFCYVRTLLMKTHQIPLQAYLEALKFMGVEDIDLDETQCKVIYLDLFTQQNSIDRILNHFLGIIANLIFENKIKGYISNSHNKLVISKQNPFPSLAAVV